MYTIHHEKPTLVEKFIKRKDEKFTALQNINLTIKTGEKVGITGPNGSGKTTLLKIIAGITTPSSGKFYANGKVISLIDLEAGFHPDLSGYHNIYINGLIIGMKKKEINHKINKIINFTDIKQFIDTPFFTFSQGMKLRLGFSIALFSNPDILLLDENFAVGDADFQKKTKKKIKEFKNKKKTIIIVSQWKKFLQDNCNRFISINNGTIKSDSKKLF